MGASTPANRATPERVVDDSDESTDIICEPPAKIRKRSSANGPHPREIGLMRDGTNHASASFVGSASGIHFVHAVYDALSKKAATLKLRARRVEKDLVPGEDDRLDHDMDRSKTIPMLLWSKEEITGINQLSNGEEMRKHVSFENLVEWTRNYFDNWHPPYPFLHAPSTLGILEIMSQSGLGGVDDLQYVILRSLISISLADSRQNGLRNLKPVPAALTFTTYDEALSCLQLVLVRPTSLLALQASLSVQVFLVSLLRLNAASRLGGLIVRMAIHLGLHRCPARFSCFSEEESNLRRRIFWSIYCLDRYLCQSLGLPLNIHDDDIDVCYPDEERHCTNVREPRDEEPVSPAGSDGRLRLLSLLSKHAKLKGMILEIRNKSIQHSLESSDQAMRISARLSKWWNDVEDSFETFGDDGGPSDVHWDHEHTFLTGANGTGQLRPIHRLVLLVSKHESLIALHRPVIATSKQSATHAAALQICVEASKSIISVLRRYLSSNFSGIPSGPQNTESSHHRTEATNALTWPSFTWAVWMSAFILMYAASEGQYSLQAASRNADHSLLVLRHLSLRGNTWADACATAIKDLKPALVRSLDFSQRKRNLATSPRSNQGQNSPSARGSTSNHASTDVSAADTYAGNDSATVDPDLSRERIHESTLASAPVLNRREQRSESGQGPNSTKRGRRATGDVLKSTPMLPVSTSSFYSSTTGTAQPALEPNHSAQSPQSAGLDSEAFFPRSGGFGEQVDFQDQMIFGLSGHQQFTNTMHSNLGFQPEIDQPLMNDPFGIMDIPFWFAGNEEMPFTGS